MFLYRLIDTLLSLGIDPKMLPNALLMVAVLVSAKFGRPIFAHLKVQRPETISFLVRECLKVVPPEFYVRISSDRELKPELIRGKVLVVAGGGLSPRKITSINEDYLYGESNLGALVVLREDDPIQNRADILTIDLDKTNVTVSSAQEQQLLKFRELDPEKKTLLVQGDFRIIQSSKLNLDLDFLDKVAFSSEGKVIPIPKNAPERIHVLHPMSEIFGRLIVYDNPDNYLKALNLFEKLYYLYPHVRSILLNLLSGSIRNSKSPYININADLIEVLNLIRELDAREDKACLSRYEVIIEKYLEYREKDPSYYEILLNSAKYDANVGRKYNFTAAEILQLANEKGLGISRSTLYRRLEKLEKDKLVDVKEEKTKWYKTKHFSTTDQFVICDPFPRLVYLETPKKKQTKPLDEPLATHKVGTIEAVPVTLPTTNLVDNMNETEVFDDGPPPPLDLEQEFLASRTEDERMMAASSIANEKFLMQFYSSEEYYSYVNPQPRDETEHDNNSQAPIDPSQKKDQASNTPATVGVSEFYEIDPNENHNSLKYDEGDDPPEDDRYDSDDFW